MSKFTDLLNSPLPSVMNESTTDDDMELLNLFSESDDIDLSDLEDDNMDDIESEGCSREGCGEEGCSREGCGEEGCCKEDDDDEDDDDDDFDLDDEDDDIDSDLNSLASNIDDPDFDPDDLSDEELAKIDAELSADTISQIDDDSDTDQVTLTPNEEKDADDMMSVAATTVLINDEMNGDEKKKFIESTSDVQAAINEGLLMESDANELAESFSMMTEGTRYNNMMIIRLSKEAKLKQLFAIGVNASASAHNDPDYRKLQKVNKMKKILKQRLAKKYHSEAKKRMKIYFKRLTTSKSNPLKELGKKLSK